MNIDIHTIIAPASSPKAMCPAAFDS